MLQFKCKNQVSPKIADSFVEKIDESLFVDTSGLYSEKLQEPSTGSVLLMIRLKIMDRIWKDQVGNC